LPSSPKTGSPWRPHYQGEKAEDPWFQSVARIGKTGNYEHVLRPAASLPGSCQPEEKTPLSWRKMLESIPDAIRSIPGALRGIPDALRDIPSPAPNDVKREQLKNKHCLHPNRTLISDVTADATGELFIYVNDAVLALPISKNIFYLNNNGSAKVNVKRVLADSIIESPQSRRMSTNRRRWRRW
jgi:hypothetical protein